MFKIFKTLLKYFEHLSEPNERTILLTNLTNKTISEKQTSPISPEKTLLKRAKGTRFIEETN